MQFSISTILAAATIMVNTASAVTWGTACLDANFAGECINYGGNSNECISFRGAYVAQNDKISSLSVIGGVYCNFFTAWDCTGASDGFATGRYNQVPKNDQYSSFRCVYA